ncbi:protein BTG3-like [Anomaloglossus baeobatrachus]|uniref:protein BTG3-like n=1 Tax=Anomaloglossus baeobatrachus TaxID=238106 RepID=UPI003F502C1B
MYEEVKLGASYVVRLLNRHQKLDDDQVKRFTETLTSILCEKFEGHWYPDNPQKGQAYRCIRIEHSLVVDDSVLLACIRSGLRCSQLAFPRNMSIWIDPQEVSCRLGDSCVPFIVKAPEEPKKTTVEKPEQDTSDYHSDGSDISGSPSESSSEDEESGRRKKKSAAVHTQKMGAQYYYNPTPSSTVFYQYPGSFVPTYQPMTLYYLVPKYYHNIRSRAPFRKYKTKNSTPATKP